MFCSHFQNSTDSKTPKASAESKFVYVPEVHQDPKHLDMSKLNVEETPTNTIQLFGIPNSKDALKVIPKLQKIVQIPNSPRQLSRVKKI